MTVYIYFLCALFSLCPKANDLLLSTRKSWSRQIFSKCKDSRLRENAEHEWQITWFLITTNSLQYGQGYSLVFALYVKYIVYLYIVGVTWQYFFISGAIITYMACGKFVFLLSFCELSCKNSTTIHHLQWKKANHCKCNKASSWIDIDYIHIKHSINLWVHSTT